MQNSFVKLQFFLTTIKQSFELNLATLIIFKRNHLFSYIVFYKHYICAFKKTGQLIKVQLTSNTYFIRQIFAQGILIIQYCDIFRCVWLQRRELYFDIVNEKNIAQFCSLETGLRPICSNFFSFMSRKLVSTFKEV